MAAPNMLCTQLMGIEVDYETWLVEAGDSVVERKASFGVSSLTDTERMIYCLWVADYGMRNAGDLDTAFDLHPTFQSEGLELASRLSRPRTRALFGQSRETMKTLYFALFDDVCREIAAFSNQSRDS